MTRSEFLAEQQAALTDPNRTYAVVVQTAIGTIAPRSEEAEKRFQAAAAAIRSVKPVPEARREFFAWVSRPDSPVQAYGWDVTVREVEPVKGGLLITLIVSPRALHGGSHAFVLNKLSEQYLLANGRLHFAGAFPLTGAEPAFAW
jgi:hypothetical protein